MSHDSGNSRTSSIYSTHTIGGGNSGGMYHSGLKTRHMRLLHPFFIGIDTPYPTVLTQARVFLELLQWAAMLLIPTFVAVDAPWGNLAWGPVMSAIAIPFHYTILPLWEGNNIYGRINNYAHFSIISWLCVGLVVAVGGAMVARIWFASSDFTRTALMSVAVHALHFITTIGFQPLIHTFLAFMVCDNSKRGIELSGSVGGGATTDGSSMGTNGVGVGAPPLGVLSAFRRISVVEMTTASVVQNTASSTIFSLGSGGPPYFVITDVVGCLSEPYPVVLFTFSLTCAVALVFTKYMIQLFVSDSIPKSHYALARANYVFDLLLISGNVLMMVLFHYLLLGTGHRLLYTSIFGAVSLVLSLTVAFLLPYFTQRTNQLMCGFFLSMAFLSLQQSVTLTDAVLKSALRPPAGAFEHLANNGEKAMSASILRRGSSATAYYYIFNNWDAVVAIVGGLLCFILGYAVLANLRISSNFRECLRLAEDGVPPMPTDLDPIFVFPAYLPEFEMHPYRGIEKRLLADERYRRTKEAHVALQKERLRQNSNKGPRGDGKNMEASSSSSQRPSPPLRPRVSSLKRVFGSTRATAAEATLDRLAQRSDIGLLSRRQLESQLAWAGDTSRIHTAKLNADQTKAEELWIGYPFLSSVLVASDVEVAARGVARFLKATGLWPPVIMLAFTVRIYTKGMAKYVWSTWLELQFVTFLSAFVPSMGPTALGIAEGLMKKDLNYLELFEAQRRLGQIGQSLLIRNNVTKRAFASAQRLHREALHNMRLFWSRLLLDHVDIVRLGVLAKVITEKRAEGYRQYLRVQSETSDQQSMLRFAQFLEQVMIDATSAQACREIIIEGLENERIANGGAPIAVGGAFEGNAPNPNGGATEIDDGAAVSNANKIKGRNKKRRESAIDGGGGGGGPPGSGSGGTGVGSAKGYSDGIDDEDSSSSGGAGKEESKTIATLRVNINVIFIILASIMIALFACGFVMDRDRQRTLDRLEYAGTARYLSQEVAALVSRLADPLTDDAVLPTVRMSLQRKLSNLRDHVSELAFGDLHSDSADVQMLFSLPFTSLRYTTPGGGSSSKTVDSLGAIKSGASTTTPLVAGTSAATLAGGGASTHEAGGLLHTAVSLIAAVEGFLRSLDMVLPADGGTSWTVSTVNNGVDTSKTSFQDLEASAALQLLISSLRSAEEGGSANTGTTSSTVQISSERNKAIALEMKAIASNFMRTNSWLSIASSFNHSVVVYAEEGQNILRRTQYITTALFICAILAIVLVNFVIAFNLKKISASKMSTLGLFTLIPRNALERLRAEASEWLERFDEPDATFQQMKAERGLEDDDDVRMRMIKDDAAMMYATPPPPLGGGDERAGDQQYSAGPLTFLMKTNGEGATVHHNLMSAPTSTPPPPPTNTNNYNNSSTRGFGASVRGPTSSLGPTYMGGRPTNSATHTPPPPSFAELTAGSVRGILTSPLSGGREGAAASSTTVKSPPAVDDESEIEEDLGHDKLYNRLLLRGDLSVADTGGGQHGHHAPPPSSALLLDASGDGRVGRSIRSSLLLAPSTQANLAGGLSQQMSGNINNINQTTATSKSRTLGAGTPNPQQSASSPTGLYSSASHFHSPQQQYEGRFASNTATTTNGGTQNQNNNNNTMNYSSYYKTSGGGGNYYLPAAAATAQLGGGLLSYGYDEDAVVDADLKNIEESIAQYYSSRSASASRGVGGGGYRNNSSSSSSFFGSDSFRKHSGDSVGGFSDQQRNRSNSSSGYGYGMRGGGESFEDGDGDADEIEMMLEMQFSRTAGGGQSNSHLTATAVVGGFGTTSGGRRRSAFAIVSALFGTSSSSSKSRRSSLFKRRSSSAALAGGGGGRALGAAFNRSATAGGLDGGGGGLNNFEGDNTSSSSTNRRKGGALDPDAIVYRYISQPTCDVIVTVLAVASILVSAALVAVLAVALTAANGGLDEITLCEATLERTVQMIDARREAHRVTERFVNRVAPEDLKDVIALHESRRYDQYAAWLRLDLQNLKTGTPAARITSDSLFSFSASQMSASSLSSVSNGAAFSAPSFSGSTSSSSSSASAAAVSAYISGLLDSHEDAWNRVSVIQNAAKVLACSTNRTLDCEHLPLISWDRRQFVSAVAVDTSVKTVNSFLHPKAAPSAPTASTTLPRAPEFITVENYEYWLPRNETYDTTSLSTNRRLATARAALANPSYFAWYQQSLVPLFDALAVVSARGTSAIVAGSAAISGLMETAIALSALLGILCLITLALLRFSMWNFKYTRHALTLTTFFSVVCVVITSVGLAYFPLINREGEVMFNVISLWNASISANDDLLSYARRAAFYKDQESLAYFASQMVNRDQDTLWGEFAGTTSDESLPEVQSCVMNSRNAFFVEAIAVTLSTNMFNLTKVPPVLDAFVWNVTSDVNAVRFVLENPTQKMFSDKPRDLRRNTTDKRELVRELLLGPIRRTSFERSNSACRAAVEQTRVDKSNTVKSSFNLINGFLVTCIVLGALSIVLLVIFIADIVRYRYETLSAGVVKARDDRVVSGDDELFVIMTRRSRLALILLALLFLCLFLFNLLEIEFALPRIWNQNLASLREFEMHRSLALSASNNENRSTNRATAEASGIATLETAHNFYRGSQSSIPTQTDTIVHQDKAMAKRLFGDILSAPASFQCANFVVGGGDDLSGSLSGASSSSSSSAALLSGLNGGGGGTTLLSDTGVLPYWVSSVPTLLRARGVDMAQRRWRDEVVALSKMSHTPASVQMLNSLHTAAEALGPAIHETTLRYAEKARSNARAGLIGYMVIWAVISVVVLYEFLFVFRPILRQLMLEEEGTRVMLKMIPSDVRERVPAIAEYLETGVVVQDVKVHEINEAAIDLSTVPTISIDFEGTILTFSKAAEQCFFWTKEEVIGKNVRMLMPDDISGEHDSYLANYRRTGVKHIIGNVLKSRAMRRNGVTFPAEIAVKEIHRGRSTTFIGTIRDVGQELEVEKAMAVSTAISDAAAIPIVVIDKKGVILRFNNAARQTFRTEGSMVGRRVNELMPPNIAAQHDSFIAKYMLHRIKNVVDKSRVMQAVRVSTGELFPIRITVKEHKGAEGRAVVGSNRDVQFIGYIEDLTRQVGLRLGTMISDAIPMTSPTPYVETNSEGIIITFSPAAEQLFGYSAAEVRGKNINILMPQEIAERHDKFIRAYYETGRKKMLDTTSLQYALRRSDDGKRLITFPARISLRELHVSAVAPSAPAAAVGNPTTTSAGVSAIGADSAVGGGGGANVSGPTDPTGIVGAGLLSAAAAHGGASGGARFVAFIEDISDQRQLEKENIIADRLMAISPTPLFVTDPYGVILSFPPCAEKVFGYTAEEAVGMDATRLLAPTDYQFDFETFRVPDSYGNSNEVGVGFSRGPYSLADFATASISPRQRDGANSHFGDLAGGGGGDNASDGMRRVLVRTKTGQTFYTSLIIKYVKGPENYMPPPPKPVQLASIDVSNLQYLAERLSSASGGSGGILSNNASASTASKSFRPMSPTDSAATARGSAGGKYSQQQRNQLHQATESAVAESHISEAVITMGFTYREQLQKHTEAQQYREFQLSRVIALFGTVLQDMMEPSAAVGGRANQLVPAALSPSAGPTLSSIAGVAAYTEAISRLATTPLVWIDSRGTILGCSESTVDRFQWARDELIGQNISILMPDSIASKHDEYLFNYRQRLALIGKEEAARTSPAIGKDRKVLVKTRDEQVFTASLLIKDIHIGSLEPVFVGYIRDLTSEIELATQKHLSAAIIQSSFIPIICIDQNGLIQEFSSAAESVFGYSRNEILNENVKKLMPEHIAKSHDGYLKAYAKTRVKAIIDSKRPVTALRRDKTEFQAELMVKEIVHKDLFGKDVTEYIGYVKDLSHQTILDQATRINELVASLSAVPIIIINPRGIIVECNTATEVDFGYQPGELVNKNVKILMPENVAVEHDSYLSRYRSTRIKKVIDNTRVVTALRRDRSTFAAELSVREVPRGDGREGQFIGYIRDVTVEQQIAATNYINTTMMDLSPVPVLVVDHRGIVQHFSRAASQTFEYPVSEVIGKNVKMLMTEEVAAEHDFYLSRYLETRQPHVIGSTRRVTAKKSSGKLFPVELNIREVFDEHLKVPVYVGFIHDLSEQAEIEALSAFSEMVNVLSPVPVISINHEGTVIRFSASAEQEFKVSASEIIGKNVKLLQQPEVGEHHDMYLKRYHETKVKHVIDNTRVIVAKRWDGTTFRASLFVKEVTDSDHEYPLFVGYIKNIEEDIRIEEASKENAAMQLLAPLPVFVVTRNGIVLDVNPAVETVFGYHQSEVKGQNIKMMMPEHIASRHDEYLRRYHITGVKHVIDQIRTTQGRHKNGTIIPIEISIREVQVPGMEAQYVGYVKDTSMSLRMVESLRWNAAIISLAATPLVVIDPDGIIMKFTLEAEKLFQYNAEEVIGKNVKMLMPPEIARKHDRYIERYHVSRIKTVIDHNRKVKGRKKNGEVFLCELGVREILNEDDTLTEAFAGYLRPIATDQSSMIEGSAEINSMMHAVSLHGVIIIDEVGIIEKANPAVAEMFGVHEASLIGKNVKILMPDEIAQNHDRYLANYLVTGAKRVIDTKRVTYAKNVTTGAIFPIELSVKELNDVRVPQNQQQQQQHSPKRQFVPTSQHDGAVGGGALPANTSNNNDDDDDNHTAGQSGLLAGNSSVLNDDGTVLDEAAAAAAAAALSSDAEPLRRRRYLGCVRMIEHEIKIERQRTLNKHTLDLSMSGTIVSNHRGGIIMFSHIAEKIFGCTAEQVVEKVNISDLMPQLAQQLGGTDFLAAYRRAVASSSNQQHLLQRNNHFAPQLNALNQQQQQQALASGDTAAFVPITAIGEGGGSAGTAQGPNYHYFNTEHLHHQQQSSPSRPAQFTGGAGTQAAPTFGMHGVGGSPTLLSNVPNYFHQQEHNNASNGFSPSPTSGRGGPMPQSHHASSLTTSYISRTVAARRVDNSKEQSVNIFVRELFFKTVPGAEPHFVIYVDLISTGE